jgi:hypothetical protein
MGAAFSITHEDKAGIRVLDQRVERREGVSELVGLFWSEGLRTKGGRRTEEIRVTQENTTRARLPMRPM